MPMAPPAPVLPLSHSQPRPATQLLRASLRQLLWWLAPAAQMSSAEYPSDEGLLTLPGAGFPEAAAARTLRSLVADPTTGWAELVPGE